MTFRIKLRRDTAAAWTSANPILAAGEPGLETDTGKIKYGDGTTAWTSLSYSSGSSSSLTDDGGVTITAGSTDYWVAAQRREGKDIYGRGVRYDSDGNVYTLTQTYDDADTVSVITKYSPTGTLLWQHSIDQAEPCALAVDSNNNAYIALEGNDDNAHLIKFASNGSVTWKKEYEAGNWQGEAFIEERTSTRLVMTLNFQDNNPYRVLVLDINTSTGDVVTTKILINDGNDMYATGIDTDADGNVFVSGRYVDSGASKDKMFVEKLDSNLDRVWSKSLETDTTYSMNGGDCASDAQGNVYAVGFYDVNTTNPDGNDEQTAGVLIKLNSSGVVQWTRRLGPGPCGQSVVGLTATDTGDVYLVSSTLEYDRKTQLDDFEQMAFGVSRMIVAKYDTAGAVLWQRYVDAEHVWENADDFRGQTIAVYDDKFIVDFYGRSWNTTPFNFGSSDDEEADYFLVQLPTDGTELTIGEVEFRESRIPGRFVTHATSTSPTVNEVFEGTVTVSTSDLTLDTVSRVANALVKSQTYDYVFGPDGTLTIPNDGDIKLTQNQTGFFAVIGDTVNYNYDTQGRAVTADSQGNTYVVGEDDDTDQPIVVKISPEGHRLWSVAIEDDNNGNSGRANGLALHPVNGNVYVVCEMFGNYTYGLLVVLDQDTGRVLDSTDYTDASNDVYLNDIVFQSDSAYVIGGSKNGNFSDEVTLTKQDGSALQKIVVLRNSITGIPSTNWQIGGTGFNVFENIAAVDQYSNLATTVREGSGATFDVSVTQASTLATVTVSDLGTATPTGTMVKNADNIVTQGGWGSWLVIPAGSLANTLIGLFTMNQVIPVTWAAGSTSLTGYVTIQIPGDGTVQITPVDGPSGSNAIAGTWYFDMSFVTLASYSVLVTGGGTNYLAGHKIKVLGSALGGTTPENDLIITVDALTEGAISSVSNSGTPNVAAVGPYTSVANTNYNVGSGFVISSFNGPTISSNYGDQNGYSIGNYGNNYVAGDVLTVLGTDLGGTSPANDLTITVANVGGSGEAYGFNFSGTSQTTNWTFITTTSVDFSQAGSWSVTTPLSRENLLIGDGWRRAYGTNTGDETDRTYAITVDSDDNIIAATQGYGVVGEGQQNTLAVVYKFNSTGTLQWARQLNEVIGGAEAKGVTTIGTDIYVTHYSYNNGDTIITKLDSSGTVKWQRTVDSSSDSSIAAASDGTLVVVAEAYNNDIGDDAIKLFKLNTNGETVYKRWLMANTQNDTRFKNGRCLYERDGYMYITSYYYAEDYDSWFVARLPLDGSGTGEYSQFRYMDTVPMTSSFFYYNGQSTDTNYLVGEIGGSYAGALNVEPYVNNTVTSIASVGSAIYVSTHFPSYFWEEILDQDGGNIVFADGSKQNTSATDTPQRLYTGAKYTLGLKDRGHHIYCRDQNENILIPYDSRVPFPIGTTIMIVNNTGNSIYIGTEGGGTGLIVAGYGSSGGAEVYNNGVATLMKIERELWIIHGNQLNSW